jgi:hypothetical protein
LERLEFLDYGQKWHEAVEHIQWLEVLRPFVSVKDLAIPTALVRFVAPVLQEVVGERVPEVLPALQNLFLEGPWPSNPVREVIAKFIVARRVSGHPVIVYHRGELGKEYVPWEIIG